MKNASLDCLQSEVGEWSDKNFPDDLSYRKLLGIIEELGELAHAHLKLEQGIRLDEPLTDMKKDAIGDLIIYLLDYCHKEDLWLTDCIRLAWSKVKRREWRKRMEEENEQ